MFKLDSGEIRLLNEMFTFVTYGLRYLSGV